MISALISTLTEILHLQKDVSTGNAEQASVNAAKKRFAQALYEMIDYRVQIALEERRASISQSRIHAADSINAAIKTSASAVKSITALNSAPPPPTSNDPNLMRKWVITYQEWYEGKRRAGVSIE
ncbi:MAG: hypothetical protein WC942_04605 [Clostridia bacterium]|jgi:prophage DNA circulation protein